MKTETEEVVKKKRTGHCRRALPPTEFSEDQNSCRKCTNDKRRWLRMCAVQGEDEWFRDLSGKQPKSAEGLLRKYSKHCEEGLPKSKFGVLEHKRRIIKKSAAFVARRNKWMWEGEYVEERTVKIGDYDSSFEDVGDEEEIEVRETLQNNPGLRICREPGGTFWSSASARCS